jgi:hypothetical protein
MGEGQWQLEQDVLARLNELDVEAGEAIDRGDEEALAFALERMAMLVREQGEPLPAEDLHPSDVVVPPADLSLDEVRELLSEDGLIPDLPA